MSTLFKPEMRLKPDPVSDPNPVSVPAAKPRIALFVSTVCGLGYIPLAPGTFGSLAGIGVYWTIVHFVLGGSFSDVVMHYSSRAEVNNPYALSGLHFVWWLNLSSWQESGFGSQRIGYARRPASKTRNS